MATIILSILIFGSASLIVYRQLKHKKSCSDCHTTCPVKKKQSKEWIRR